MRRLFIYRAALLLTSVMYFAARAAASDTSLSGPAHIRLASVFSDHMVLQRDRPVPVWGTAHAGDRIAVRLSAAAGAADTETTRIAAAADASGKWSAQFAPMRHGGPYQLTVSSETDGTTASVITLEDILVGDVWLCSGQSNMGFTLEKDRNGKQEIDESSRTQIRFLKVGRTPSAAPLDALKYAPRWELCGPSTVGSMSAVAWYFGRELQEHLDVPVGLVVSAVGGTSAECWASRDALREFPEFDERIARIEREARDPEFARQRYERELATWNKAKQMGESGQATSGSAARKRAQAASSESKRPSPEGHVRRPTVLYNGMIAPLAPMALKGVIWYQGESNSSRAAQYRRLFPAMIRDWRRQWNDDDLPFLFVQLPFFHAKKAEPADDAWAELREAQLITWRQTPATGMAVAVDTGDAKDIHPTDKKPIGARLILAARAIAYGEKLIWSGPLFTTATVEISNVRLAFDHTGSGLAAADGSGELRGFAIAGVDRKFVWADARIEPATSTVVVSSPQVPRPVAVRYSWAANPDGNLCNREGLPASPFRTDKWPGITEGNTKDSAPINE